MATNYAHKEPVRRAQRLAVRRRRNRGDAALARHCDASQVDRESVGERGVRPPPDFSFANYSRPQPESILT